MTATEAIQRVNEACESPLGDVRFVETISQGQFFRQGDIYLVYQGQEKPNSKSQKGGQLAPGTTQGSRHTVGEWVEVYPRNPEVKTTDKGTLVLGPTIFCPERFTVEHPEHADGSLPAGCYDVFYQFDPRTNQRAKD